MRVSLKTAVVTGEVTVLVACTAVGIHLFMQPHRFPQAPPALALPTSRALTLPVFPPPPPQPSPSAAPQPSSSDLTAGWITQLNRDDRTRVGNEWEIVQRLTRSIEWFLVHRVVPAMEGRS